MARIVKEEAYAARRKDILDTAQRMVYTKGYEQMTIQDILDHLHISKGAFYHYFDSKGAVLEALVMRMAVNEAVPLIGSIVEDPHLSALEKLHGYFDASARWKTEEKAFMLELLRVWRSDENAIFRQKMSAQSLKWIAPLLTDIIRQGVREGVFNTPYPDQAAYVVVYILLGMSETLIDMIASGEAKREDEITGTAVTTYIDALTDALERVLGAKKGSIHLIDPEFLKEWFPEEERPRLVPSEVLVE
jgi:AcrR family transcriptional regulator